MSPYRTRLLLAFMVFAGVVMVCVRVFDEPEPDRNPFLCPDCGKLLPEKDGVCASCQGKKAREKMDAASRNPGKPAAPEKYSSKNREKAIYAIIAFFVLMAVALWPQIHRFIRSRQHGPEIAYRIFRCQRCRRKLRYRAIMVGTQGMCPTCKEVLMFPEGEEDDGDDGF